MKRLALLLCCLSACACGSEAPTAPSIINIAGLWTGTLASSNLTAKAVAFQIDQSGTAVTGTWTGTSWDGVLIGQVAGSVFTGTVSMSAPNALGTPGACTGSASITGPIADRSLRWTGPGFSGNCTGIPLNIVVTLQR